ncbi:GntR family transcriptional regulator [Microbacterium sp. TWP3-1-2b2]|uniref:GntR family transcriptional regulator n=1 Tax=Microbacterium sp. TWP3-1-2b2 TaxID=2804651 RepID=UPI003CF80F05
MAGNMTDDAFEKIERMIVLQEIAPGSLISEKQLTEATGIGRTPVREALQRLARDRMVEIHPQRGVLVPPSSIEAQLKLLELRRNLEPFAVRLAAERASAQQRDRATALMTRARSLDIPLEDFPLFLRDAHDLIVAAAHNEFLSVAMAPLQGLSRRFWFSHLSQPAADIAEAATLHAAVLEAVAGGDVDAAAEASLALNDYLVRFAYATLPQQGGATSSAG